MPETPSLPPDPAIPALLKCEDGEHPVLKRALMLVGAVLCFVFGVVGWLVPVITGIPFYVAGLVLLAKAWPAAGRRVNAWEAGWPVKYRLWLRPRLRARLRREQRERDERAGG